MLVVLWRKYYWRKPGKEKVVGKSDRQIANLNTIVRIDRSARLVYPDWVGVIICPELENVGPEEYDLEKHVELWRHPRQIRGRKTFGIDIYKDLECSEEMKTCLGFRDAQEIVQKGIEEFRRLFGDTRPICWKSIVRDHRECLRVLEVFDHFGKVGLSWCSLDGVFDFKSPAARFVRQRVNSPT